MMATRMPFSVPMSITPDERGQRPEEFRAANGEDVAEFRRLDEPDGIDDDDAGQHGMRHQA